MHLFFSPPDLFAGIKLFSCLLRHFFFKKNPHWRIKLQIINYRLNFTLCKFGYFVAFSIKRRSTHSNSFTQLFLRHFSSFHFIFKFIFVQCLSLLSVSFRTPQTYHSFLCLSIPFVYLTTLFVLFYICMLRKRHISDIISVSEVKYENGNNGR